MKVGETMKALFNNYCDLVYDLLLFSIWLFTEDTMSFTDWKAFRRDN